MQTRSMTKRIMLEKRKQYFEESGMVMPEEWWVKQLAYTAPEEIDEKIKTIQRNLIQPDKHKPLSQIISNTDFMTAKEVYEIANAPTDIEDGEPDTEVQSERSDDPEREPDPLAPRNDENDIQSPSSSTSSGENNNTHEEISTA